MSQEVIDGLVASLDAHKQLLNEQLNVGLQLRTQAITLQRVNAQLTQKLADANAKIAALEAPQVNEPEPQPFS